MRFIITVREEGKLLYKGGFSSATEAIATFHRLFTAARDQSKQDEKLRSVTMKCGLVQSTFFAYTPDQ